jgi:hypothetical protein
MHPSLFGCEFLGPAISACVMGLPALRQWIMNAQLQ